MKPNPISSRNNPAIRLIKLFSGHQANGEPAVVGVVGDADCVGEVEVHIPRFGVAAPRGRPVAAAPATVVEITIVITPTRRREDARNHPNAIPIGILCLIYRVWCAS